MPIQTRYLFSAAMDVAPAQERLFNEVYDQEHVPSLLTVPGVIAASIPAPRAGVSRSQGQRPWRENGRSDNILAPTGRR